MFLQFTDMTQGSIITINSDYIIQLTQSHTSDKGTALPHTIEVFTGMKGGNWSSNKFSSTTQYTVSDSDYQIIIEKLLDGNGPL